MEIDLAQLREDAGAAAPALIAHIAAASGDRAPLISHVQELCTHFVTIAASTLLLEGRPQPFFLNLCRAAENWRRLLSYLEQQGLAPPPASSGLTPLAGAVVACHGELAVEVATRLARSWQKEEEYEAEFAWANAFGALVLHVEKGVDPSPQIDILTRAAHSKCWPELAQALVRGEAHAFVEAFEAGLREHTENTERLARSFTTRVDRFAAHRYLWFEGLALLRLARKRGLVLAHDQYRYCPPLALAPVQEQYQGDWVINLGSSNSRQPEG